MTTDPITAAPRITRRLCESGILPGQGIHRDCGRVSEVDATLDGVPVSLCIPCAIAFARVLDAESVRPFNAVVSADISPRFYVLAIGRSGPDCLVWWGSAGGGYVTRLAEAGRFTDREIDWEPGRFNNGVTTVAIDCRAVDAVVDEDGTVDFEQLRALREWPFALAPLRAVIAALEMLGEEAEQDVINLRSTVPGRQQWYKAISIARANLRGFLTDEMHGATARVALGKLGVLVGTVWAAAPGTDLSASAPDLLDLLARLNQQIHGSELAGHLPRALMVEMDDMLTKLERPWVPTSNA